MKTIKIFLASSSELKIHRNEFEMFIRRKNDTLNKDGVYLNVIRWENFIDAMSRDGLQAEYNKAVQDCDIFVSLFHTKVGRYTEEEFSKALETFQANGKPLIFTYFNQESIPPNSDNSSLIKFRKKLSDLKHYPTDYNGISDLLLKFDNQLSKIIQQENPSPSILLPGNSTSVINSVISSSGVELKDFGFSVLTVNKRGEEVKREKRQAQYFTEELGNSVTLDMIAIPSGKFIMGSQQGEEDDREKPQHEVTVQPFFMGKYPVTQAQYQQVMSKNPSKFEGVNCPVEQVSWDDAIEFCQRLSKQTRREYRLPSEAEWEYACRSRTTTPFNFGKTITTDLANYRGTNWEITEMVSPGNYADEPKGQYREETTAVGMFLPNLFGLYDMHGQVWEWCQDDFHENYGGAPIDGRAWSSGSSSKKVVRGGSWNFTPWYCRSACRIEHSCSYGLDYIGFRIVCSF